MAIPHKNYSSMISLLLLTVRDLHIHVHVHVYVYVYTHVRYTVYVMYWIINSCTHAHTI